MSNGFWQRLFGADEQEQAGEAGEATSASQDAEPGAEESESRALTRAITKSKAYVVDPATDGLTREEARRKRRRDNTRRALERRRERKLHDARVQAIMGEVLGTLAKVGSRLDEESERSAEVQTALAKLPDVLAALPEQAERERAVIETLRQHVQSTREFQDEAVEHLRALPQIVAAMQDGHTVAEHQLAVALNMAENYVEHTRQLRGIGGSLGQMAESVALMTAQNDEQEQKLDAIREDFDAGMQGVDEGMTDLSTAQLEARARLLSSRSHLEDAIERTERSTARRVTAGVATVGGLILAIVAAGIYGLGWQVEALERLGDSVETQGGSPFMLREVRDLERDKAAAEQRAQRIAAEQRAQRMVAEQVEQARHADEAEARAAVMEAQVDALRQALEESESRHHAIMDAFGSGAENLFRIDPIEPEADPEATLPVDGPFTLGDELQKVFEERALPIE